MSRDELCAATGVTEELLADLESYGLIDVGHLAGVATYDAESQMVARTAVRCIELGIEPRHLRMYKVAAEREAGFVEQLVMPLLKQRNPAVARAGCRTHRRTAVDGRRSARGVAASPPGSGARNMSRVGSRGSHEGSGLRGRVPA